MPILNLAANVVFWRMYEWKTEQKKIIAVVDEILTIKKSNPLSNVESLEKHLNDMVYKLYGLTDDEIMEVESV